MLFPWHLANEATTTTLLGKVPLLPGSNIILFFFFFAFYDYYNYDNIHVLFCICDLEFTYC